MNPANLSAEERRILDQFDDVAATILVLQRDGFSCRAAENLMENFTRHITLFFGGIIIADGTLHEAELSFFSYVVRHEFDEQEFQKRLARYQKGKAMSHWVNWVPEYLDTLVGFDQFRNSNTVEILMESLHALGKMFTHIDGAVHTAEQDFVRQHLQVLEQHLSQGPKNLPQQPRAEKTPSPLRRAHTEMVEDPPAPKAPPSNHQNLSSQTGSAQNLPAYGKAQQEKPQFSEQSLAQVEAEVKAMIGLENVKEEISNLSNVIRISSLRRQQGLPVPPLSLHLVFTGNPGTGKTTIARKLAQIYKHLGILSQGHLVEVDRAGMVAGYMGQTAIKTAEVIESALGGILFVDEAYTLASEQQGDYGQEAIDTLLKAMEDHRDNLVVIAAGYPNEMKSFVKSNPGLQSRFKRFVHFPDYQAPELSAIFQALLDSAHLKLDALGQEFVDKAFVRLYKKRGDNFGNGRTVRNIFEHSLTFQANRLVTLNNPGREELSQLDVRDVIAGFKSVLKGF